ncbi:hypothetical protein BOTBODRAFT_471845 [Botryobasidium botryosum FD-172 SS1]|uniref:Uncharacterized protein n=1 Tax=Botryobasidium botryosum (strain FD-172 SS1) TaxID=930990 RepID=A0A067M882_BOTB1|nr:hypothetical protein BOTBODRAFT_471845 [Botryobasidium botryosum FD-172 SS1]
MVRVGVVLCVLAACVCASASPLSIPRRDLLSGPPTASATASAAAATSSSSYNYWWPYPPFSATAYTASTSTSSSSATTPAPTSTPASASSPTSASGAASSPASLIHITAAIPTAAPPSSSSSTSAAATSKRPFNVAFLAPIFAIAAFALGLLLTRWSCKRIARRRAAAAAHHAARLARFEDEWDYDADPSPAPFRGRVPRSASIQAEMGYVIIDNRDEGDDEKRRLVRGSISNDARAVVPPPTPSKHTTHGTTYHGTPLPASFENMAGIGLTSRIVPAKNTAATANANAAQTNGQPPNYNDERNYNDNHARLSTPPPQPNFNLKSPPRAFHHADSASALNPPAHEGAYMRDYADEKGSRPSGSPVAAGPNPNDSTDALFSSFSPFSPHSHSSSTFSSPLIPIRSHDTIRRNIAERLKLGSRRWNNNFKAVVEGVKSKTPSLSGSGDLKWGRRTGNDDDDEVEDGLARAHPYVPVPIQEEEEGGGGNEKGNGKEKGIDRLGLGSGLGLGSEDPFSDSNALRTARLQTKRSSSSTAPTPAPAPAPPAAGPTRITSRSEEKRHKRTGSDVQVVQQAAAQATQGSRALRAKPATEATSTAVATVAQEVKIIEVGAKQQKSKSSTNPTPGADPIRKSKAGASPTPSTMAAGEGSSYEKKRSSVMGLGIGAPPPVSRRVSRTVDDVNGSGEAGLAGGSGGGRRSGNEVARTDGPSIAPPTQTQPLLLPRSQAPVQPRARVRARTDIPPLTDSLGTARNNTATTNLINPINPNDIIPESDSLAELDPNETMTIRHVPRASQPQLYPRPYQKIPPPPDSECETATSRSNFLKVEAHKALSPLPDLPAPVLSPPLQPGLFFTEGHGYEKGAGRAKLRKKARGQRGAGPRNERGARAEGVLLVDVGGGEKGKGRGDEFATRSRIAVTAAEVEGITNGEGEVEEVDGEFPSGSGDRGQPSTGIQRRVQALHRVEAIVRESWSARDLSEVRALSPTGFGRWAGGEGEGEGEGAGTVLGVERQGGKVDKGKGKEVGVGVPSIPFAESVEDMQTGIQQRLDKLKKLEE